MRTKRGRVSTDPAPLSLVRPPGEDTTARGLAGLRSRHSAGCRAATTPGVGGLQLPSLARLRVVALPAQLGEDPRLLHLLLEALERPVEAIIIAELNLDQSSSLLSNGDEWGGACAGLGRRTGPRRRKTT